MKRMNLDAILPEPITGHTSKGDQPKWQMGDTWYKADHMGSEALSEVLVSQILSKSNVTDFVTYEPVWIEYHGRELRGCLSKNFRRSDEMLVPFEKLHRAYQGVGLASEMNAQGDVTAQLQYTVEFIESVTGLCGVGAYLTTILELDAFTLNEDRHTNNLAVIRNEKTGEYRLCPIFDNGLSLLSDEHDYPIDADIFGCIEKVKAKPFSRSFDEQLEAAESLYGSYLKFNFKRSDIHSMLEPFIGFYDEAIINRAERIVREQMRRYPIFF